MRVACNNGAGGSTEKSLIYQTYLTEPQGIIKKLQGKFRIRSILVTKRVVRNEMEDGSTERQVKFFTRLTEPQGIIKI